MSNPTVLERVELHKTKVAHGFIDFWSTGEITLHEVYIDSNSPFDIDKTGYHVMMSIRGEDVKKLRNILNNRYI